ncbi:MAG: ribosome recycling factor [Pirellulaceae bacterium]|nr:ribosome recycling factor [Pirellulaceae bacterium]
MSTHEAVADAEDKMQKAIDVYKKNLGGIRTGRANPGLVESLRVDAYGTPTPLKQLATIGTPEPQQILIRPYDTSLTKDIEKAIVGSDLGLNPQGDGRVIRLNIPPLSSEVRKKLVARVKELTEDSKIALRNIRRDANKHIEQAEKAKEFGEDQRDTLKDDVQNLLKEHENQITALAKKRETEVLED